MKMYEPPKEHDEFYKWLGLCISRWSYTEEVIFGICHLFLSREIEFAAIVYYRTPSIDSRLSLMSELVTACFRKGEKAGSPKHKLQTQLNKAVKEIRDLLPARNALAHHQVTRGRFLPYHDNEGRLVREPQQLRVKPSPNEEARGRSLHPPMTLEDMKAHYPKIEEARQNLRVFQSTLLGWLQKERVRLSQEVNGPAASG